MKRDPAVVRAAELLQLYLPDAAEMGEIMWAAFNCYVFNLNTFYVYTCVYFMYVYKFYT